MNKHLPAQAPACHNAAGWMIQSDFDGTISLVDVTDSLLQRFGLPGWTGLEDAWERGDIGSRDCMQGQVALLDMDQQELDAHLDGIAIDPGFPGFVQAAQVLGLRVQVVSDGIDYAIQRVLARHGLGHLEVIANRLVQKDTRRWALEAPWASPHCKRASGNCKCERLAAQQAITGRVLYVGDSTSDFCVSHEADYVLAKYRLIGHCERHGIAHAPFLGFSDATPWLQQFMQQQEALV
ncbi:MtnX-like HAD-IB family phosphatase [uncultured Comamonas sp.]|uniref:MtnX-like HAD-IB family phosphatase n=1 Tax=uncultured Comamonas sp. TaxID=114710 RepID=UPI0037484156